MNFLLSFPTIDVNFRDVEKNSPLFNLVSFQNVAPSVLEAMFEVVEMIMDKGILLLFIKLIGLCHLFSSFH